MNKDDSKYLFAKLLLDSRIRRDNEKLNKVISTYGELKAMIEKYPLSSAKEPNNI